MYSLPVLASDEIAFFMWADLPVNNAKGTGVWAFLTRTNCAGYGVIYWDIYILFKDLFGAKAVWYMRALALVAWLSIPVSTVLVGNAIRKNLGWLLSMLWISMPIAWWSGKVTGPETFSLAFAFCGIMLLAFVQMRRSNLVAETGLEDGKPSGKKLIWQLGLAWFLIGVGVGFKLTMLPAVVFALLISYRPQTNASFFSPIQILRSGILAGIPMKVGFVLSNPVLIFNRAAFFDELGKLPRGDAWSWFIAQFTLSNSVWAWDGVFSGGLIQWSLVPWTMAAVVILAFATRIRNGLALFAGFLACWAVIVSTGSTLGWYWFGLIPLIIPSLLWTMESSSRQRFIAAGIVLVAISNAYLQRDHIRGQITMKAWHGRAHAELPELQEKITAFTQGKKYDSVIDYSEITFEHGLMLDTSIADEIVQTSPPVIPKMTSDWQAKVERLDPTTRERGGHLIQANAFVRITQWAEKGTEGKLILVILSKRLMSKHGFADFNLFWKEQVLPKSPAGTELTQVLELANTVVFEIRTPTLTRAADSNLP